MPDENEELWNEAMALLLRWQARPKDAKLKSEIVAFCAQSQVHHDAWDRAKRLYRLTGEATGAETPDQKRKKSRRVTRRKVLTGIGAVVVGAGVVECPGLWRRFRADIVTEVGNIEERRLPDGSRVTLGPDTVLNIAFSPAARSVTLLEGMALFEIAHDQNRPFQAATSGLVATAEAGMSFEIRQNGGRGLVGVDKGQVVVEADDGAGQAEVLSAGEWLVKESGVKGGRTGYRDPGQIAAWRQRQLIAEQDRIDAIVAEIARWQSSRVVIAQASLADSRVSGLYDLRDPHAALEAVVEPYGGRAREITPWLTVLSTI
jgi:transmembrane sensor